MNFVPACMSHENNFEENAAVYPALASAMNYMYI